MKRECCICKKSLAHETGTYLYPAPGQRDLRAGALYCKECGNKILKEKQIDYSEPVIS